MKRSLNPPACGHCMNAIDTWERECTVGDMTHVIPLVCCARHLDLDGEPLFTDMPSECTGFERAIE